MPSKKPIKAAKKPGKAIPKKAVRKAAVARKAAQPPPSPKPITSKVPVKPQKPAIKAPAAKPAAANVNHVDHHPPRVKAAPAAKAATAAKAAPPAKPSAGKAPQSAKPESGGASSNSDKAAPIKFDPRPLVMPTRATSPSDEDADGESGGSASLLAGPRNVKPYIARRGEQYMNKEQLDHFALILQNWKRDLMVEVDRTVLHMKDEAANFPDPNDRATQEEEFSLELRTRDRERKLIRKIDEALKRIEDGSYGYCLETGEEIGIKRLEARPVATLSVEAQERRERREKQYGDRDDRYR
jgi:DnaK suppressor protein